MSTVVKMKRTKRKMGRSSQALVVRFIECQRASTKAWTRKRPRRASQSKPDAKVIRVLGTGITHHARKVRFICDTDGRGLWSRKVAEVNVRKLEVAYVNDEGSYGELRVYFDRRVWKVDRDGLIYTDRSFKRHLELQLQALGLNGKVEYSEQGMQGDDYVSLDVFRAFLRSWINVNHLDVDHESSSSRSMSKVRLGPVGSSSGAARSGVSPTKRLRSSSVPTKRSRSQGPAMPGTR